MKIGLQAISDISNAMRQYPAENWVDALSSGQLYSKEWLISEILHYWGWENKTTVHIVGSWLGMLPLLMYERYELNMDNRFCIGYEPNVNSSFASGIVLPNRKFRHYMHSVLEETFYEPEYHINTCCEHFTESDFKKWLMSIPLGSKVALQSNNFFDCEDHINCKTSLTEFEFDCTLLSSIEFSDKLDIEHVPYTRYMIIGTR